MGFLSAPPTATELSARVADPQGELQQVKVVLDKDLAADLRVFQDKVEKSRAPQMAPIALQAPRRRAPSSTSGYSLFNASEPKTLFQYPHLHIKPLNTPVPTSHSLCAPPDVSDFRFR
ncbi:hypothetical protein OC845_006384 [Tilletia horrida]|nr:hypothetical protein OC845_006384 [Tilletia horrida]